MCGCAERRQLLTAAARNVVRGNTRAATRQAGAAFRSLGEDAARATASIQATATQLLRLRVGR
jgi:hypothetical protein